MAAILGLLVATSLWLAYFDFFAIRGERLLEDRARRRRIGLARDIYTYAHFPMIAGIVLFAFAMKTIVAHVGEELDAPRGVRALRWLRALPARLHGDPVPRHPAPDGQQRSLRAAFALIVLLPVATAVPALAALALVTAVWVALHAYELIWWREARAESRSALTSSST